MIFNDDFNEDNHSEAVSWTEYLIGHLLKAKYKPEEDIIVMVPNETVQGMIDIAISELCTQSTEAWQLKTKICTVH